LLTLGRDAWSDLHPIVMVKKGTTKSPILLDGYDSERYVACTGWPADTHDAAYLTIRDHKNDSHVDRCPDCGKFDIFHYRKCV
jgi:cytochrome c oxidase subunit 5b